MSFFGVQRIMVLLKCVFIEKKGGLFFFLIQLSGDVQLNYSRASIARPPMTRLPWLIRTSF